MRSRFAAQGLLFCLELSAGGLDVCAFGYRALGRLVPLNEEQVTRIFMRVL